MEAHQNNQPVNDDLIFTLLQAALSLPECEREVFLAEACSSSPDLLAEVRRRVDWDRRLAGFLMSPIVPRERMDHPFAAGELVLNRFRIERVAGEGGMGVVYEAFDEKLRHRVAIKCPRFEFRKRLTPEARNSLSIAHPNVCSVRDIHTAETISGDVDFLVMEFLQGETLAARFPQAPKCWLSTPEGAEIGRQICAGLRAVHAKGIVHRDLKAGNVMLSRDESGGMRAVIMDFGISQGTDLFSSRMRGTPAYLAPELWKGQAATVQSDLYALGVLFYEMAAGRKPFPEGTPWKDRLDSPPPAPEIGEPMRAAILRCLAPEPRSRVQSVAEFERQAWRSRRWLMRGLIGIALTAAGGKLAQDHFWPASPIVLAIRPPSIPAGDANAPLITGFLLDLSYRFKTLRARRPLSVIPLAGTASIQGATHVLSTMLQHSPPRWSVSSELVETATSRPLRRWTISGGGGQLPAQLFALQAGILQDTTRALLLRSEPVPKTLTAEVYPDYVQGLYYIRDQSNPDRAIPYFQRVIDAAPDSALGFAGLAESYLGKRYLTGDESFEGRALDAVAKAEQLDPDSAHVQLMGGRLAAAGGSLERARHYFNRTVELDPRNYEAFIQIAISSYMLNQLPSAEAAVQAAVAVEPTAYQPYMSAGLFYYEVRNFAAAERYWSQALRLAPDDAWVRASLATLYIAKGRLGEAGEQVKECLKRKFTQEGLAAQAALQELGGSGNDAIASYQQAIALGPETYKIWAGLGGACRRAGRAAEALGAFGEGLKFAEKGRRNRPREAERVAWCAYYLAFLGEHARARELARQALEMMQPPQPALRKLLVLSYGEMHDFDHALPLLDGAPADLIEELARSPDLAPALRRDPRFARFY